MIDAPPLLEAPLADLPPTRIRARRWVTVVLGLVTFVAGGVAGAGLYSVAVLRQPKAAAVPQHKKLLDDMKARLDLTEAQVADVEKILVENRTRLEAIQKEVAPRYWAEFGRMQGQVKAVLSPEQQQKWEAHNKEMREKYKQRNSQRPNSQTDGTSSDKSDSSKAAQEKK